MDGDFRNLNCFPLEFSHRAPDDSVAGNAPDISQASPRPGEVFRHFDMLPPQSCKEAAFFTITRMTDNRVVGCSYRLREAELTEDTDYRLRLFIRENIARTLIERLGTNNLKSLASFRETRQSVYTCFPTSITGIAQLLPEKSRTLAYTPMKGPLAEAIDGISNAPAKTYLAEDRPVTMMRPDDTFLLVAEMIFYPIRMLDGAGIEGYNSPQLTFKRGANIIGVTVVPDPMVTARTIEVSITPVEQTYLHGMPVVPVLRKREPQKQRIYG